MGERDIFLAKNYREQSGYPLDFASYITPGTSYFVARTSYFIFLP